MQHHYNQHPGEYYSKNAEFGVLDVISAFLSVFIELFQNVTYAVFRTGLRGVI